MDAALELIQSNITYAPYIILGLLLLAGLNLPVSEDIMLFTSGILAAKHPEMKYTFFICVFLGCYLSDIICYFVMGRYLGTKIFKISFFAKMVSPEKIDQISNFYKRYGIFTLILGRFIPFGVRNALFISAGLAKMPALKFAMSDFVACSISSVFFFCLYYTFGESVIEIVKKGNMVLLVVFCLVGLGFYIKKKAHANK
jgi:membrane protein DedA with SNARE-associated domain